MKEEQLKKEIGWLLKEKYKGKLTKAAKKDIVKLKKGEPVDYLIGFVEFAGCNIDISFKPLIPRAETEYWVQKSIEDMQSSPKRKTNIQCLDMFAGSGCIGIAVLKKINNSHVEFVEKEKGFIQQILFNLKRNKLSKQRFSIICSDVFGEIKGTYDYIFANPPYIAQKREKSVQSSVLTYEPKDALFAGKDGLKYIKKFLKEARYHLAENGKIYLEFDSPQKKEINMLLKEYNYSSWKFHKDQYNKWRFVVIHT